MALTGSFCFAHAGRSEILRIRAEIVAQYNIRDNNHVASRSKVPTDVAFGPASRDW